MHSIKLAINYESQARDMPPKIQQRVFWSQIVCICLLFSVFFVYDTENYTYLPEVLCL